jgi:hypothetical protein
MKRIVVAALTALMLTSCSASWSADLTRPQAKAILSKTKTFNSTYNQLNFVDNGFQQFAALGVNSNNYAVASKDYDPELAKIFTVADAVANTINLRTPLPARVDEITGIADAGQGMKEVLFRWTMVNVPDVLKPFVAVGGTGKAIMRLYDDGWRVENGPSLSNDTTPPTLTAAQKAQIDSLREAHFNRVREAAAKAQSAEKLRLEKVAASKTPTQTLYKFKAQTLLSVAPFPDKRTTVDVEVTDANVTIDVEATSANVKDSGRKITLWFGCLSSTRVSKIANHWDYRAFSQYLLSIGIIHRGEPECYKDTNEWIQKGLGSASSLNFDNMEEAEKANGEIEKAHQAWLARYADIVK